jgi:hypothetical protein
MALSHVTSNTLADAGKKFSGLVHLLFLWYPPQLPPTPARIHHQSITITITIYSSPFFSLPLLAHSLATPLTHLLHIKKESVTPQDVHKKSKGCERVIGF